VPDGIRATHQAHSSHRQTTPFPNHSKLILENPSLHQIANMVAISSFITAVAVFLSSTVVAAPGLEIRQDPNPQIFSLSLYNDCSQTQEITPVGLTRTPTLNQQGCYNQTTPFGALFINAHINGHPECRRKSSIG
jgi:hypothetical protein